MYPFIGYSVRVNSKIDKECLEHRKRRWEENVDRVFHIERRDRRASETPVFVFPQFAHVGPMQNFHDPISFK